MGMGLGDNYDRNTTSGRRSSQQSYDYDSYDNYYRGESTGRRMDDGRQEARYESESRRSGNAQGRREVRSASGSRQSDGRRAGAQSGSGNRRRPSGSSGGNRTRTSGSSGRSRSRNAQARGKRIPWQRKVRRFFRRLGRSLQRLLDRMFRKLRRLPAQAIVLIGAAVIALVLVLLVVGIVSLVRRGSKGSSSSSETSVVSDATTETEETSEEQIQEDVQEETSETLLLLQGLDSYTLLTDETEIASLTGDCTEIEPSSCQASSVLTGASTGTVFGTSNMFDDDLTTSWQEGEDGSGIGVTITTLFSDGTELAGIAFWTGNEIAESNFEANNRPAQITITVTSGEESYDASYTLQDLMGEQVIFFDEAIPAESLVIRIDSVYEGTSYDDTVISEMKFLGAA